MPGVLLCVKLKEEIVASLQGVDLPSYIRWEVVPMNFDFKDLMAFGMFILALLAFIFDNCK